MGTQQRAYGLSLFDAARAMGVTFEEEAYPEDRYVTVNALRLHYLDWGKEGKQPMLLLHGGSQTAHSWDFVALAFRSNYHVYALDARGHGDSDWSSDGTYTLETHQEDIAGVVGALGLDRFALMGLSMGGRNAFMYTGNHPEQVATLVIVDVGPETQRPGTDRIREFTSGPTEFDSLDEIIDRVLEYNPRRSREQVLGSILHNVRQRPDGKWTWKTDRRRMTSGPIQRSERDIEEAWDQVRKIRCPTLIVRGGESDVFAPETAERMHQIIPGSHLATVPGASHLVMGDNPSGFQEVVRDFLGQLPK